MKSVVIAISLGFISFISWNCTKIDTTVIGSGLIPAVDNVNTFDTIVNVISNNIDSVKSDCARIYPGDDRPLGYISNDPFFGATNAIIYSEFKPAFFPFTFHTAINRTLDSVVLVLKYRRSYGDSSKMQKVNVFQLTDANVHLDTSTCSFHDFDVPLLGSVNYIPKQLNDTTRLRINLGTSLQSLFARDSSFLTDSAFKKAFHGFALSPDINFAGSNSLSYFNLADTNTKLVFYYKYTDTALTPPKRDNVSFILANSVSSYAQSGSYITRFRNGSEITYYTGPVPNTAGDSVIYIQTSPGTYALIKMPGLANVSNRIIHRAELIIDQVYDPSTLNANFTSPNFLFLDIKDSGNSFHLDLCDFNFSSGTGPNLGEFGGFRRSAKDYLGRDISRYTFNISRYVQNIVTKRYTPRIFRLYSPATVSSGTILLSDPLCTSGVISYPPFILNQPVAGRVKLGGGTNTNSKMRLHIIYSRL